MYEFSLVLVVWCWFRKRA